MKDTEEKSPKFYVAEGNLLRSAEAIDFIYEMGHIGVQPKAAYRKILNKATMDLLKAYEVADIITKNELHTLLVKFHAINAKNDKIREEKAAKRREALI
jgi:hypothetical protein